SNGHVRDFIEMLDCAVHGAPRAFEMSDDSAHEQALLRRAFAREARRRGWIAIDAEVFGRLMRAKDAARYLQDRSLVVFVNRTTMSPWGMSALMALAIRDVRPHVLVYTDATRHLPGPTRRQRQWFAREVVERFGDSQASPTEVTLEHEARARWKV